MKSRQNPPLEAAQQAAEVERLRSLVMHLPQAGAADARVVETHISLLLLSGAYAWKFKKPVWLPFADFRDAAERARLCRAEVTLNRRLAAQLYLGVERVTGTATRPRLGGRGAVIEHAVRMRRFAQRDEAGCALAAGRLSTAHLHRFGAGIAAFHAAVEPLPGHSPLARPGALAAAWRDDMSALATLARGRRAQTMHALDQAWSTAFRRARTAIGVRRRTGCVRACHGDLHLGNLVLLDDALTAFDCIEFNDQFRFIDTCDEVAFLYMDLERARRPLLARAFLDGYLQTSGDYRCLALLPLFAAYRASVRAKIGALRLAQQVSGVERRRSLAAIDRYLRVASRFLAAPTPGRLLLMYGVSGSGKSWLGAALAAHGGCLLLRSDLERRRLYAVDEPAGHRAAYTPRGLRRTYRRLCEQAAAALQAGFHVIVDATFLASAQRAPFLALGATRAAAVGIVETCAPRAVLERRVAARAARGEDASQADIGVLRLQYERQKPLSERERGICITVRTDRAWNAAGVWRRLQKGLAAPAVSS